MAENYTPRRGVVIGKHWRRPKTKVYDCNLRDAERFYQASYKDYLLSKESAAKRAAERQEENETPIGHSLRRAGSGTYLRSESLQEPRREGSYLDVVRERSRHDSASSYEKPIYSHQDSTIDNTYVKSRLEITKEKSYTSCIGSFRRADENQRTTLKTKHVRQREVTPDAEIIGIEHRLERLRKLRQELGLPSEIGADTLEAASSSIPRAPSEPRSSVKYGTESSRSLKTSSSTARSSSKTRADSRSRGDSRSRANGDANDIEAPTVSTERRSRASARARAAAAAALKNEMDDYSLPERRSRSDARSAVTSDEYDKYTKRPSFSESKTATRRVGVSASGVSDLSLEDDDALLPDLRRKLPTSQEILERIKNMDL